jgi:SPP1 family predicted phage head-tail adaptor
VLSRRGASDAGRLRLKLILERATPTPDGTGESTLTWNVVATLPADVTPVKADEREAGEGLSDLTLHRIVIRKRADIFTSDRFRLGARKFRIRSISDPDEDARFLQCLCEEEGS